VKYILILALFVGFLQAKSADACYSVQLKSFYLKRNSSYDFERQNYPSSCILVNINGMRSVRCGCYDDYREAEDHLDRLSQRYYDAIIVDTYKRRFENKKYEDAYHSDRRDNFSKKSRYDEYPPASRRVSKKSRYDDGYGDDFSNNQDNLDEKTLYTNEVKPRKRSFYGQEEVEAEDDLYDKNDNVTVDKEQPEAHTPKKEQVDDSYDSYDDDTSGSTQTYYKRDNSDYARTSGRW
jgi:hypothetical protein